MRRNRLVALLTLLPLGTALGQVVPCARADLLVSSRGGNNVLRYAETDGAFLGAFAADPQLVRPGGLAVGPDGNLYVSINGADRVLRFSGVDGLFLGLFASATGLRDFAGIAFGPDGNLYVNSNKTNSVLRFDGRTGSPLPAPGQTGADFVPPRGGGLFSPSVGIAFGPDGNLYVNSKGSNAVMRYDGNTGEPRPAPGQGGAVFIPQGSGNAELTQPAGLVFGPDGRLYVTTHGPNTILRFEASGAFVDDFIPAGNDLPGAPTGLTFGPDGNLYVADSRLGSRILRYDGRTGEALPAAGQSGATFLPRGSGGLNSPDALLFFSPGGVPAPRTLSLLGIGLAGLAGYGWRRWRTAGP